MEEKTRKKKEKEEAELRRVVGTDHHPSLFSLFLVSLFSSILILFSGPP